MTCIHLKDIRFFAHHGVHAPEWDMGGYFDVCMDVWYREVDHIAAIEDTINYEDLYKIVETFMLQRQMLLEVVAQNIIQAIKKRFPQTTEISIRILKLRAPIAGLEGSVGVTLQQQFT